jgi:hypothetical protein
MYRYSLRYWFAGISFTPKRSVNFLPNFVGVQIHVFHNFLYEKKEVIESILLKFDSRAYEVRRAGTLHSSTYQYPNLTIFEDKQGITAIYISPNFGCIRTI